MSGFSSVTFPLEIIEAILCRSSAKSLCRFKSVSKSWESLISDPSFTKTHIRHLNKTNSKLILRSRDRYVYSLDNISATAKEIVFPLHHPLMKWKRILGSCNGLVLALDVNNSMFLMNPTTRELRKVPQNPFKLPLKKKAHRFVKYGFGYVPSTDDYKIVSISLKGISGEGYSVMVVSLYSLRDNLWKKLGNAPYDRSCSYMSEGALVNHNLHWGTHTRYGFSTVIAFSLENEEFGEIQLPENCNKNYVPDTLVFHGKLAIFGICKDLWVMEEYGVAKSWTKVCCFHGVDIYGNVTPLCLVHGSDRDMVLRDSRGMGKGMVLVFNIDNGSCIKKKIDGFKHGLIVECTYVESLESPARYITFDSYLASLIPRKFFSRKLFIKMALLTMSEGFEVKTED